MKYSILLSSAILFATAVIPMSAYADDSNLKCRRLANGCDTRNIGGNEKISISGFDIEVKSSDRGNRNRDTAAKTNDNVGNGNDATFSELSADHADADDTDNANAGNDVADNTPDTGNVDPGTDNNDTGGSNNTPPQLNSNDINGFDPFGGLYGPGT